MGDYSPLGRATPDDIMASPSSVRKVSDSESLRALASMDASTSAPPPPPPPATPHRHRRKSTKDRTPRQVQAVLSARKLKTSTRQSLGNVPLGKDQTPMNLLRALSRMGDLPPATPEEESEEEEEEESGGKRRRKRGRPSRASELGEVEEEEGDEDDASGSGGSIIEYSDGEGGQQQQDDQEEGNVGTARRTSHFPPSMQFPDAHLPQRPYPPSQSNFDNRLHEYDDDDGEEGGHEDLRRMSTFSSRSVEAARRLSFATSLGGSPGAMGFDGEDSFVRRGSFVSEGASMRGRVSEIGFEGFGDDRDGKSFSGESPGRYSVGSGLANKSSVTLRGEEGDESLRRAGSWGGDATTDDEEGAVAAQLLGRRQGAVELGGGEDEEGEDGERMGDDAGGWDDDDGERIPWEDKGKGPAVDFGDQFDDDDQGDDQEGAEAGLGYEGFSDDDAPVLQAKQNIFPVPGGVKAKKTAGKKLKKKKKKQRYTSDGRPVGELPKSFVKSLFQHFLGPGVKLAPDAMEEVMNASHEFFEQLTEDAAAYASHAGRKSRLHESDLVTMMYRQRVLSDTCGLQALGRQHGLDRELLSVIDAMGAGGKGVGKGGKKRKAEGGHEGEKKQRRKSGKGKGKGRESSEEEDAGEGDNGAESQEEEENGGDSE